MLLYPISSCHHHFPGKGRPSVPLYRLYECIQLHCPWLRVAPFPMLARYRGHFHATLALDKIDHQFACTGFMSVSNLIGLGYELCLSPCWRISEYIPLLRVVFQHWPWLRIVPFPLLAHFQGHAHTASALSWVAFLFGLDCKLCLSPCWRSIGG